MRAETQPADTSLKFGEGSIPESGARRTEIHGHPALRLASSPSNRTCSEVGGEGQARGGGSAEGGAAGPGGRKTDPSPAPFQSTDKSET